MADDPVTPPPRPESGYAHRYATGWWQQVEADETPELRWPSSVVVYDRMRRQDAQIGSVLRAVTLPVRRTTWRVDGTGCRDEVTALVATDMGLPVAASDAAQSVAPRRGHGRFSWAEHLQMALLMLPLGHMFFEQSYRFDPGAGLWHLRRLAPRMPRSIAEIEVGHDGGLVHIRQHARAWTAGQRWRPEEPIPVDRLVAYVCDREGGDWVGSSLLRSAYKNWLIKDRLLRVQAQTVSRNGMGMPLYEGAEGEVDLARGEELARAWRAGDDAGAAIPHGAKLLLRGVEGDLPDADKPIRYHDEQIARAVLAHVLNLGTQVGGQVGSYALGSTLGEIFTQSLQTVAEQIADVATQHVVEDLVDVNWGPDEPAPRVVFDEIGSRRDATAEAIRVLVDAGALTTDDELEDFVRTAYGLPGRDAGAPTRAPSEGTEAA